MKKHFYYDKFPITNKIPRKGEVWIVKFPYETKGNMEKIRPCLVSEVIDDDTFICTKITSNSKRGKLYNRKYVSDTDNGKKSYITDIKSIVKIDKFYRRIDRDNEFNR